MSLQSIGNGLSLQQIMQQLQQQSLGAADPEAAGAGAAGKPHPAGQNLPADQPAPEENAGTGAQLAPAKPTLDAATIKTLLAIQEAQARASDDALLYGTGASALPDAPLMAAVDGEGENQNLLMAAMAAPPTAQPAPDFTTIDPTQLQSMLAAMTGSAASGDAIASMTDRIMDLLEGAAAPVAAMEE